MFYEEIRINQGLSYISFCGYFAAVKVILMATFSETNDIVVTRVHCTVSCTALQRVAVFGYFVNWNG